MSDISKDFWQSHLKSFPYLLLLYVPISTIVDVIDHLILQTFRKFPAKLYADLFSYRNLVIIVNILNLNEKCLVINFDFCITHLIMLLHIIAYDGVS